MCMTPYQAKRNVAPESNNSCDVPKKCALSLGNSLQTFFRLIRLEPLTFNGGHGIALKTERYWSPPLTSFIAKLIKLSHSEDSMGIKLTLIVVCCNQSLADEREGNDPKSEKVAI